MDDLKEDFIAMRGRAGILLQREELIRPQIPLVVGPGRPWKHWIVKIGHRSIQYPPFLGPSAFGPWPLPGL